MKTLRISENVSAHLKVGQLFYENQNVIILYLDNRSILVCIIHRN